MMITLKIDPARRYQTILGFGASGCWWAGNWRLHGWPFAWLEETIALLKREIPDCCVMVGGAVLTADYAEKIGADYYAQDARRSVAIAQEFFGK